ncbi:hypothetical protein C9994_02250, partial [Marivirga lumbricoides]
MPKVAVVCLCYNHEAYVKEALNSVVQQTFKDWELIIVDDASKDNSINMIEEFILENSSYNIQSIFNPQNLGNCKAFNKALARTNADYIIDLAADDILLPMRLEEGVKNMNQTPKVAINFSNAHYINPSGDILRTHYVVNESNKSIQKVPQGYIFPNIIKNYFICSPTMMYRGSYLREIGGYDESLAYEDFDLKIRLSRNYPFSYIDKILVQKRVLPDSMSVKQYRKGNKQLNSTYLICCKIYLLIQNKEEKLALLSRLAFEAKQAFLFNRLRLFMKFSSLWAKT